MPPHFRFIAVRAGDNGKMVSRVAFSLCLNRARRSATFCAMGIRAGNSENFSAIAAGHRAVCCGGIIERSFIRRATIDHNRRNQRITATGNVFSFERV